MTTAPSTTPKPRRRWYQHSLRTLMVLMLVLGSGFGWLGMELKRAREQRKEVEAIEEMGGQVADEPAPSGILRTAVAWLSQLLGEDLSSFRKRLSKMELKEVEELPPRFWRLRPPEGGRYVLAVSEGQFLSKHRESQH
jgi:hypothetical protein